MKSCTQKYSYFAYLEGTLNPSERKAFEHHLSVCTDCQENVFIIQEFLARIDEEKTIEASPYTFTKVMGRIEQNRTAEERYRKWQPAIIGMVSIVAIVAGMFLGNYFFKNAAQYASYLHMNDARQEVIELSLLDNN